MIARIRAWAGTWRERILARAFYDGARDSSTFRLAASPPATDAAAGTLARLYDDHAGRATRKWTHFPALYDRYFAPYRGRPVRLLEIGISTGGSLEIWRSYFGADAMIAGIDIDPATAANVSLPNRAYIGDQADPELLRRVVAECGPFDIIIDDGSHVAGDQMVTLRTLWPALADGGLYVVEDTMTAYLPRFYRGGYRRSGTAIDTAQWLIDDLHGWTHGRPSRIGLADLAAVHAHATILFLEKASASEPRHGCYGGGAISS